MFSWLFVLVTLTKGWSIEDFKLKSVPGKFLAFWDNYGALLEFIPIIWHYKLAYNKALANKTPSFTDDIFDPLRELVVEFLVKGINKSMLSEQKSFNKCHELLKNLGTVGSNPRPEQLSFDEETLITEAEEEEHYNFPFRRSKGTEKLQTTEFLLEDIEKLNRYVKVSVIAPKIFGSLRRYFGIEDNELASIFSLDKLKTGELKIKLGSGHGGSFFIYPASMRFLLKTIKKTELAILRKMLPKYFQYLTKQPKNFINPIIALFAISIKGGGIIEPVHFLLMPNVLPFDRSSLPHSSKVLSFDIKGSLGQRLVTDNPEKLLSFELLTKEELDITYKDVDFLKSFRCLELEKSEAKPIVLQLKGDTDLLCEAKLFDYSMMLFIIATPLIVANDLPSGIKLEDLKNDWKIEYPLKDSAKENPCIVAIQIDKKKLIIRYTTTIFILEFHISQQNDIDLIKDFLVNTKYNSENKKLNLIKGPNIEEIKPLLQEEEKEVKVNNDYSDQLDFKEFPLPNKNMKLINSPIQVFKESSYCQQCLEGNTNHLVISSARQGIRKIGVYQLAIKKYNRTKAIFLLSSYLELIDYLTTYTLKRKIEKSLKIAVMKEPSVEEPTRYAERFMRCIKTVFSVES